MAAIPCMLWVRRGVSKRRPTRAQMTAEEMSQLDRLRAAHGEMSEESGDTDDETAQAGQTDELDDSGSDDITKRYSLDDYDNDEPSKSSKNSNAELSYHKSNKEDPYLKNKDEDSDDDDAEILPDDNLLCVGRVSDDLCPALEVYVHNESSSSFYCHHDTIMTALPLAMEWIGFGRDSGQGNFLAVASMEPDIEIWNLDLVDTLHPVLVLKGAQKKKGKKKSKTGSMGHTDAVLDLSWNTIQQHILASGSADNSIGLWDLEDGTMATRLDSHTDKVQTLEWHPFENQTLLSGSFDNTVKVYDCRTLDAAHNSWTLPGEVERVTWNRHNPFYFLSSTDTGHVYYMDVRSDKPVFDLKAHRSAVTGLVVSTKLPGCLVTSSDKLVKVWDIGNNSKPDLVYKHNYQIEEIQCLAACPDSGWLFAAGGETQLKVFDLQTVNDVAQRFTKIVNDDVEKTASGRDIGDADQQEAESSPRKKTKKKSKKVKKVKKPEMEESSTTKPQLEHTQGLKKRKKKHLQKVEKTKTEAMDDTEILNKTSGRDIGDVDQQEAESSPRKKTKKNVKKVKKVKKPEMEESSTTKPQLEHTHGLKKRKKKLLQKVQKTKTETMNDTESLNKKRKLKHKKKTE